MYNIIIKPIISEKSVSASEGNKFTFKVIKNAEKVSVASEFKELFGIKPISVRIMNVKEKTRSKDHAQTRKPFKKAIVTVAKDQKVDLSKIK